MKYLIILVLITACEYITACTPEQSVLPWQKCAFGDTAKIVGGSFYVRCKGQVVDPMTSYEPDVDVVIANWNKRV